MTINIAVFSLIVGVISILFAIFWLVKIRKSPSGTKEMLEINQAVDIGSRAYLKRQYQVIGLVGFIIFFILRSIKIKIGKVRKKGERERKSISQKKSKRVKGSIEEGRISVLTGVGGWKIK